METTNTRPIFPWYKERLLKAPANKLSSVSSSWRFANMIRKQIRREYVTAVEENLKQRPSALYTHYKDHMTAELFDKVVSILDPDMCVNSASSLPTPTAHQAEEEEEKHCKEPSEDNLFGSEVRREWTGDLRPGERSIGEDVYPAASAPDLVQLIMSVSQLTLEPQHHTLALLSLTAVEPLQFLVLL
ncbi:hypothetical protein INR49_017367 [Caranx melampygus]|nr:hypothetical protein INR49_017367 [Caranx melampygus]